MEETDLTKKKKISDSVTLILIFFKDSESNNFI